MKEKNRVRNQAINEFLGKQSLIDLDMKVGDLVNRVLSKPEEVAGGHLFALDRYVLVVSATDDISHPEDRLKIANMLKKSEIINLNFKLKELTDLTVNSKLDEIATNLFAWDKYVFIVQEPAPTVLPK